MTEELAQLLLGFVVNVAAKEDPKWHNACSITLRPRDGEEVQFQTFNSTWPFELKVRSWLPVVDEEGKIVGQVPANEANLRPLLGEEWLQDNPQGHRPVAPGVRISAAHPDAGKHGQGR